MSIPATMKAYVVQRNLLWPIRAWILGSYANHPKLVDRPVPQPRDDELLVKVETFAANPTDTAHLDFIGVTGSIIGCDFVGTVVKAGSATSRHKVGDRVFGVVHGGKFPEIGAAAEYCVIADEIAMSAPESWSNEDVATLGVPFLTAVAILYDSQKVAFPPARVDGEPWYLVSGGATSVGMYVIQLAKLAGYKVVASASPKSFDLVRSYGADAVVSYHDFPKALEEIRRVTGGRGVALGVDCVGGKPNVQFAVDAFGPEGGLLTSIMIGGKSHRSEVTIDQVLLYRYLGRAFTFIPLVTSYPAEPEKRAFLVKFAAQVPEFIKKHRIKPNPVNVSKGWESLVPGFDKLRKKKVSGQKLVFDLK